MNMDEDNAVGSRLAQPPQGVPLPKAEEVGDITIAGQEFCPRRHGLARRRRCGCARRWCDSTASPALSTSRSIRNLTRSSCAIACFLLTREKLRFIEHTLPPYVPGKKHKSEDKQPVQNISDPDFEILAELRGHADAEFYRIQIEFVDAHSHEVLYNGLYHIRPEASDQQSAQEPAASNDQVAPPPSAQPPVPESTVPDTAQPTTTVPSGNTAL